MIKQVLNELTDAEIKVIYMIRKMGLFDVVEIKYAKRGELQWQLKKTERGSYEIELDRP